MGDVYSIFAQTRVIQVNLLNLRSSIGKNKISSQKLEALYREKGKKGKSKELDNRKVRKVPSGSTDGDKSDENVHDETTEALFILHYYLIFCRHTNPRNAPSSASNACPNSPTEDSGMYEIPIFHLLQSAFGLYLRAARQVTRNIVKAE